MMGRKSEAELELIRESGRWCARAHRLLQEYSRVGATETAASLRAGHEATLELFEALGDEIGQMGSSDGASAGTAARSGCAARGRTRSRTTSCSSRATCSSPRRARPSGATTPSSSGR